MSSLPPTTPPAFNEKAFTCPICCAYSAVRWERLRTASYLSSYSISTCEHCAGQLVWVLDSEETTGHTIHPSTSSAPSWHVDLPNECQADYDEAKDIVDRSPRGAGALLRLCLEKLCAHLTERPDKSINDNIKALVSAGLPTRIQQSLDYLRVVGNNAVHPGQLDLNDSPGMVHSMFELINVIVENQITQPKTIENLYNQIPEDARQAIDRRGGKS